MASNHVAPGRVLDYVNTTATPVVSGGVVVAGNLLGVALVNIAVGASGSVALDGVFSVPKVVGKAIAQGQAVVYSVLQNAFTTGEAQAGDLSGPCAVAFVSAGAGAAVIDIKFTGVPASVAA